MTVLPLHHLSALDYAVNFPDALDEFPTVQDKRHFFDGWVMNRAFTVILNIEQYLIDNIAEFED
jgi:hypothetical protein